MRAAYFGVKETYPTLIDDLLSTQPEMIAVDTETISLKDRTLVGIGIATSPHDTMYFPLLPEESPWLDRVISWLRDDRIVKIYHNCMFDIDAFSKDGRFTGIIDSPVIDTMIMAQLAGYPSKLTDLATWCGTESQDMKTVLGKLKTTLELPPDVLAKKCCLDVKATFTAYHVLKELVDMDYVREEMKLIPILIRMQQRGLVIDHDVRRSMGDELQTDTEFFRGLCKDEGFNPASPSQVGYILAKRGNYQVIGRTNGKVAYKTGEEVLNKLDDPLAAVVLGYRHAAKEKSTYIDPLEGKEKLYTHFSFETATRRLASANTNLQNWPKHLRKMVKGPLSGFDFSQQELRTLAYVSNDCVMKGVFERGEDIHTATASFVYGIPMDQVTPEIRRPCKNTNFALLYGASAETVAETAGIEIYKARDLIDKWMHTYRQAADWMEDIKQFALTHRRVPTIGGAWLYIKEEKGQGGIERKAVNYSIQGSAAELTKKTMIRCAHLPMMLQIHDELLFDGDVRDELMKLDLAHTGPFLTPIDLKYMEYWG